MSSFRTDLTSLKHLVILYQKEDTFFWKRIWLEVECQYYKVPYEWVAIKACLNLVLLGLLANPVIGE